MKKVFSKIIICFSCCATILFLFQPDAESIRDIPDDNLAYPVLLVSGNSTGSGFFYNKEDATYLITARHVLFKGTSVDLPYFPPQSIPKSIRHKTDLIPDPKNNKSVLIFYGVMSEKERDDLIKSAPLNDLFKTAIYSVYNKSQQLELNFNTATLFSYSPKNGVNEIEINLKKLYESGQIRYHPSRDVALIKVAIRGQSAGTNLFELKLMDGVVGKKGVLISGLEKDNFKLFSDVLVGNPVFAFGYPTSISRINPFLNIQLPLLRKGIVAGKNDSLKLIILDCPMFYGNSGGLVIEAEETSLGRWLYRAIGVITNLVPFIGENIVQSDKLWLENSGYSVVIPMDFVEELIESKKSQK